MKIPKFLKIFLIIVVSLAVLYIAFGFLVLPKIVKSQLVSKVSEMTQSEVTIKGVKTNPLLLTASLNDFKLTREKKEIVSFKYLLIDFKISSILKRSLNFSEITLSEPFLYLSISPEGRLNLLDLIPDKNDKQDTKEKKDDGIFPLLINRISFNKGNVVFEDFSTKTPYKNEIKSLSFALKNLSTHPNKEGLYELDANLNENGIINWKGKLELNPVRSQGSIKLEKINTENIWKFIQDRVNFVVSDGELNVNANYSMDLSGEEKKFNILNSEVFLNSFSILEKGKKNEVLSVESISLKGIDFDLGEQNLVVSDISTTGGKATARISEDGKLNFTNLYLPNKDKKELSESKDENSFDLNIKINSVDVSDYRFGFDNSKEGSEELVVVPSFIATGFSFNLGKKSLDISKLATSNGKIFTRLDEEGEINFKKLSGEKEDAVTGENADVTSENIKSKSPSIKLNIGEIDVSGYTIKFEDKNLSTPSEITLSPTNLNIKNFSLGEAKVPVTLDAVLNDAGKIEVSGELQNPGFTSDLQLKLLKIPLKPFEPYIKEFAEIDIEDGNLSLTGQLQNLIEENNRNIKYSGNLNVSSAKIKQSGNTDDLISWADLKVSEADFDLNSLFLKVKRIDIDKLYSNVVIYPEGNINFKNIVKSDKSENEISKENGTVKTADPDVGKDKFITEIGEIKINGGILKFSDLSINPAFNSTIDEMEATLKGLSSKDLQTAKIDLKGKIDKYAPIEIKGEINPLGEKTQTDITVNVEGVELTNLSTYSGKHVGYKLDRGKLSLDLEYMLNEKLLEGKNKIVFDQIKLGNKVESPDAKDLPLELAISLLKDRSGAVKLDFPVSGDPNDPKFNVSELIFKTFFNLIFKAVTSPFSILGSIVGIFGGGDELSYVSFEPGSSKLSDKEKKELEELLKALSKRPNLKLEIRGTAFEKTDRVALAERQIINKVRDKDKRDSDEPASTDEMKDILEIYKDDYGVNPLDKVPEKYVNGKDVPKSERILTAYLNSIEKLKAFETVKDSAMTDLAKKRADSIRDFLTQKEIIEQKRIFTLQPSVENGESKEKIKVSLSLGTL